MATYSQVSVYRTIGPTLVLFKFGFGLLSGYLFEKSCSCVLFAY